VVYEYKIDMRERERERERERGGGVEGAWEAINYNHYIVSFTIIIQFHVEQFFI